jgi:hypothetical protein
LCHTEYITWHIYPNATLALFVHFNVKDALNALFTRIKATDVFPFLSSEKYVSPYICAKS